MNNNINKKISTEKSYFIVSLVNSIVCFCCSYIAIKNHDILISIPLCIPGITFALSSIQSIKNIKNLKKMLDTIENKIKTHVLYFIDDLLICVISFMACFEFWGAKSILTSILLFIAGIITLISSIKNIKRIKEFKLLKKNNLN
ncbi:hypothetical protein [Hathewaya limosa]|uniref:Uncharacterized protein n=1 Tax=Hathewaya limosa TaxID=1536 RepID=A0ABU0JT46_HATLI|nr:hypothetical protein [Hathewaya limosa]MDQ0480268.1 hypothetical protein [Hathewaya limosa]